MKIKLLVAFLFLGGGFAYWFLKLKLPIPVLISIGEGDLVVELESIKEFEDFIKKYDLKTQVRMKEFLKTSRYKVNESDQKIFIDEHNDLILKIEFEQLEAQTS